MSNRCLKQSWLNSRSIEALSAEAERLMVRLILSADSFGRFDADPIVILSTCFPLRVKTITVPQIEAWLLELVLAPQPDDPLPGIVRLYEVTSHRHLQPRSHYGFFVKWARHNPYRAKVSRFPDPADGTVLPIQEDTPARKIRDPLRPRAASNHAELLDQQEWGRPGSLITLYNACAKQWPKWKTLKHITAGRLEKEAEYLKRFPDKTFWEAVMRDEPARSRFLQGLAASKDRPPFRVTFDWFVQRGARDRVENCIKVEELFYRDDDTREGNDGRPRGPGAQRDRRPSGSIDPSARYDGI